MRNRHRAGWSDVRRPGRKAVRCWRSVRADGTRVSVRPDPPVCLSRDRMIGHSDQADLAMLARNIAEGKGPVVDCVWITHNGGLPGDEITHPEPYWSIYVAAYLAPFFSLFGATHQSAMLAGSLVKTVIAAIACFWTIRLSKSYLAATATAAFLLLRTYVPVSPLLSDILLCILATVTCVVWAWSRASRQKAFS